MIEPNGGTAIALTMGEPAGVGGEIALAAWARRDEAVPPFMLLDDPERLRALAHNIGIPVEVEEITSAAEAVTAFAGALPVLPVPLKAPVAAGKPDAAAQAAVIDSIDRAIELALGGAVAALVTNPVHKETLYQAGFTHPGHTEYLAERAGLTTPPVMMLATDTLRVVPVTIHLPLRQAIDALSADGIVHCGTLTATALEGDFGIANPSISVAGLNPHAGESGHLGREEIDIIEPAVRRLRSQGLRVAGPLPADTLFHEEARGAYDAVICMYHDQALIPLKTLDFHGGVNVTLGLPFVRTSPDHGTAFNIAGTGRANPASLMAALRMAAALARRRKADGPKKALA